MTTATTSRMARCPHCGTERPSADRKKLAFFEDQSPGSKYANEHCRNCCYTDKAHDPSSWWLQERGTVVEQGKCSGFESMTEGRDHDLYYCGCRGWN